MYQSIKVVDADTRTRRWFLDELGDELPPALPFPDDGFAAERAAFAQSTGRRSSSSSSSSSSSLSLASSSKPKSALAARDKTVLRFFCAFQDNSMPGRESSRGYVLHYFVEDDTVEVKASKTEGVDRFPYLLRRQQLPLNSFNVPGNDAFGGLGDQVMVTWEDLRCGGVVAVYGHVLVLLSCDARTTDWYAARSVTQRPLQLTAQGPNDFTGATAGAPPEVPPYNGFGDEDDDYAMGRTLEPRGVRQSVRQSVSQAVRQAVSQAVRQSVNQSINETNHSVVCRLLP
jgi:hypothetical protein